MSAPPGTAATPLDWLLDSFAVRPTAEALLGQDQTCTYGELAAAVETAGERLTAAGIGGGDVALVDADYSPTAVALLLALLSRRAVAVPVGPQLKQDRTRLAALARAGHLLRADADGPGWQHQRLAEPPAHPLLRALAERRSPGLIVFSSGSTGEPKAVLHDFGRLAEKYRRPRPAWRTAQFLTFDHLGGLNTLLHTLANHGAVVALSDRRPEAVARVIERHRIELLPATPTFLNLLLLAEAHRRFDLTSLRLITYGAEPMPQATLSRLHRAFPGVRLQQTYGLTELGVLRTRSRGDDTLWLALGGEGVETRIRDGVLQVRSRWSMLGYLDHPSPFDAEGWLDTQDEVEVDGPWIRFKGRRSQAINVGGEKVHPSEVESVLLEIEEVADATATGEPHPLTGQIVVASITLRDGADPEATLGRLRRHCHDRLERHKVPVKIRIAGPVVPSDRLKKMR